MRLVGGGGEKKGEGNRNSVREREMEGDEERKYGREGRRYIGIYKIKRMTTVEAEVFFHRISCGDFLGRKKEEKPHTRGHYNRKYKM